MGIDLTRVQDASLTGKVVAGEAANTSVYTFELDGMEWDIRDRRGILEIVNNDTDSLQNEK
jgi:protein involved in ribonucleotide reduction